MTEYELHTLIAEAIELTFTNYESWIAVTAAVIFAGYYGRGNIGPLLRRLIIGLYLVTGSLLFSNLVQISYTIQTYLIRLSELGAADYPFNPITSLVSGIGSFGTIAIGSFAATFYFYRVTKSDSGAAN